jgi:hypothetical protein
MFSLRALLTASALLLARSALLKSPGAKLPGLPPLTRALFVATPMGVNHVIDRTVSAITEGFVGRALQPISETVGAMGFSATFSPLIAEINNVSSTVASAGACPRLLLITTSLNETVVRANYTIIEGSYGLGGVCTLIYVSIIRVTVSVENANGRAVPRASNVDTDVAGLSVSCDGLAGPLLTAAAQIWPSKIKAAVASFLELETMKTLQGIAESSASMDTQIPISRELFSNASLTGPVFCFPFYHSPDLFVLPIDGSSYFKGEEAPDGTSAKPPAVHGFLPRPTSYDMALLLSDSALSSPFSQAYRSGRLRRSFPSQLIPGWPASIDAASLGSLLGLPQMGERWRNRTVSLSVGAFQPPSVAMSGMGALVTLPLSIDARLEKMHPSPLLLRIACVVSLLATPVVEPRGCDAAAHPPRITSTAAVVDGCRAEITSPMGPIERESVIKHSFEEIVSTLVLPAIVVAIDAYQGFPLPLGVTADIAMHANALGLLVNLTECPVVNAIGS